MPPRTWTSTRVQDEVDAGGAADVLDGGQVLRLLAGVAQGAGGVVGVLEVAAHGAGAEQPLDEGVRTQAVAGLAVGGHRHVDGGDDAPERGEGEVGGDVAAVGVAERLGHADAGRRDRERALAQRLRARRVPGIAQDERRPGAVQRAQGAGEGGEVVHGVSFAATPSRVQALIVMPRKMSAASSASEKCSAAAS